MTKKKEKPSRVINTSVRHGIYIDLNKDEGQSEVQ